MVKKTAGLAAKVIIGFTLIANPISHIQAESPPVIVNIAGDVRLDGYIWEKIKTKGHGYPFKRIQDMLGEADINCVNLECAVSEKGAPTDKKYTFRAQPESLNALVKAGINMVTVANNHTYDYGCEAFLDTLRNLEDYGIKYAGGGGNIAEARKPLVFELKGKKIAFLAYSNMLPKEQWATSKKCGTAPAYLEYIKTDVAKAKKTAGYVFVIYHGGTERSYEVKSVQNDIARTAIDAGADGVFGHHTHRLGKLEFYQGKLVCHGLGNFLFLSSDKASYKTMMLRLEIGDEISYKAYPMVISDAFVMPAGEAAGRDIIKLLEDISDSETVQITHSGAEAEIKKK